MGLFDGIDLGRLYDTESDWAKEHMFPPVTDELIERAERAIGYTLPPSYRELLRFRNGGVISDEFEGRWLDAIYGISPDPGNFWGLEAMFDNWISEWEYPNIGIPFGETPSAGHDMFFLDFRTPDGNGEPAVVRIDNEMGNEFYAVAGSLPEFIRMVLDGDDLEGVPTGEGGPDLSVPRPKSEEKKSFFSKLFG